MRRHHYRLAPSVIVVLFLVGSSGCGRNGEKQSIVDAYYAEVGEADVAVPAMLEEFIEFVEGVRGIPPQEIDSQAERVAGEAGGFIARTESLRGFFELRFELEVINDYQEKKARIADGFIELISGLIPFIEDFGYNEADAASLPGFFETRLQLYCDKVIEAAEGLEYDFAEARRIFRGELELLRLEPR